MDRADLEEMLSIPLDAALEELGRQVVDRDAVNALPLVPHEYVLAAREWLGRRRTDICGFLLNDPRCAAFLKDQRNYELIEMASIIFDVLRTAMNEPTCAWASVYLARTSLKTLCGGSDAKP